MVLCFFCWFPLIVPRPLGCRFSAFHYQTAAATNNINVVEIVEIPALTIWAKFTQSIKNGFYQRFV